MSTNPLVSVIIPSYNHENFVTRAVESVLEQTVSDLEVIVVDDGSTDNTPDQVKKINDARIKLICLEENRLKHPRNLALELTKGKFVAFQNSDDEWLPEKLFKQINILEEQKNLVACFTDVELIDENNSVLTRSWANGLFTTENRTRFAWLKHFFTAGNNLCVSSAVVRHKDIKKVGGFRGNLIQLSDFDLWVRLAAIGDFHIINEKLTLMRIIGDKQHKIVGESRPVFQPHINLFGPVPRIIGFFLPASVKAKIRALIGTKGIPAENINEPTQKNSAPSVNLSAPSPAAINRSLLEHVAVLQNFSEPPIIDFLPSIFEDTIPDLPASRYVWQAWLAKHAWTFQSGAHALFADHIMTSILEEDEIRNEVTSAFGAEIIKEYFQRRGKIAFKFG